MSVKKPIQFAAVSAYFVLWLMTAPGESAALSQKEASCVTFDRTNLVGQGSSMGLLEVIGMPVDDVAQVIDLQDRFENPLIQTVTFDVDSTISLPATVKIELLKNGVSKQVEERIVEEGSSSITMVFNKESDTLKLSVVKSDETGLVVIKALVIEVCAIIMELDGSVTVSPIVPLTDVMELLGSKTVFPIVPLTDAPCSESAIDEEGLSDVPDLFDEGFLTWCEARNGQCVDFTKDKCETAFYDGDTMGCKAKYGDNFLCCMSEAIADAQCSLHMLDGEDEYQCIDVDVCEINGGTVLKAKGLCGGKACRKCCRLPFFEFVSTTTQQTTRSSLPTTRQTTRDTIGPDVSKKWSTFKGTAYQSTSTPGQSATMRPASTTTQQTTRSSLPTTRQTIRDTIGPDVSKKWSTFKGTAYQSTSTPGQSATMRPASTTTQQTTRSSLPPTRQTIRDTIGPDVSKKWSTFKGTAYQSTSTPGQSATMRPISTTTVQTPGLPETNDPTTAPIAPSTHSATTRTTVKPTSQVIATTTTTPTGTTAPNVSCENIGIDENFSDLPDLINPPLQTWCEARGGTCVDARPNVGECVTAYYKNDDMGCKVKYGNNFLCCQSPVVADVECTIHKEFEKDHKFECMHVDKCKDKGGEVLKATGLCGGKACRKCCRIPPPIFDFLTNPLNPYSRMASNSPPQITPPTVIGTVSPGVRTTPTVDATTKKAPCFTKDEMNALKQKIIEFEGTKLKAYDANPDPDILDWTICMGFNLKRDDARAMFGKVLPGVNFDDVYKGTLLLTKEQCLALLENDLKDKYIPTALTVVGDKYCELPILVRIAIVNAVYRGDLKASHDTAMHMRNGDWCKVKAEYLDHDDYRKAVANNLGGVKTRMEWNAEQFHSMCIE